MAVRIIGRLLSSGFENAIRFRKSLAAITKPKDETVSHFATDNRLTKLFIT